MVYQNAKFCMLTWNISFIVDIVKIKIERVQKKESNIFIIAAKIEVTTIYYKLKIAYSKLKPYITNEYLPFVHPCIKLHKCFSQEHRWAHPFPNVGCSHISLQFSPKYPGGHSIKQKLF